MHRLESQYSPENLKARIEELSRQQRSDAPAPAAMGQLQKEADKRSSIQSLASVAQPQEQDGGKRIAPGLDHDSNTAPQQRSAKKIAAKGPLQEEVDKRSAQPQEQNESKLFAPSLDHDYNTPPQQVSAEKFAAKGQIREETDKKSTMQSLASVALPQEQNGRKRFAPSPDHDSNTLPQQPFARRICRDPVSMIHPIQSMQQPYQHPPGVFAAETAPYRTTYSAHYSLGASSPVPAMHMSLIRSEYGSGTPASRGFLPFGLVGSKYGFVPNFNDKPYTVAGTPHYSLS